MKGLNLKLMGHWKIFVFANMWGYAVAPFEDHFLLLYNTFILRS